MSAGFLLATYLSIHSKNTRRPMSQGFPEQNPGWLFPETVYLHACHLLFKTNDSMEVKWIWTPKCINHR